MLLSTTPLDSFIQRFVFPVQFVLGVVGNVLIFSVLFSGTARNRLDRFSVLLFVRTKEKKVPVRTLRKVSKGSRKFCSCTPDVKMEIMSKIVSNME